MPHGKLIEHLSNLSFVKNVTHLPDGAIRVMTTMLYPNNEYVDVYVRMGENNDFWSSFTVDDGYEVAETWIDVYHFNKSQIDTFAEICKQCSVKYEDGSIAVYTQSGSLDDLCDAMLRVAVACVKVAEGVVRLNQRSIC